MLVHVHALVSCVLSVPRLSQHHIKADHMFDHCILTQTGLPYCGSQLVGTVAEGRQLCMSVNYRQVPVDLDILEAEVTCKQLTITGYFKPQTRPFLC